MQMRFLMTAGYLSVVVIANSSCNYEEMKGTDKTPSHRSDDIVEDNDFNLIMDHVLKPSCVSCHNTGIAAAGINLTKFAAIKESFGTNGEPLVVSGDAQISLLYKIMVDGRMPPSGPLNESQIQLIRCWIDAGAHEHSSACIKLVQSSDTDNLPSEVSPGEPPNAEQNREEEQETEEPPQPEPLRFAQIFDAVLEPYCIGCHNTNQPVGGLDVTNLASMLDSGFIFKERSEESPLFLVVNTGEMPMFQPRLADELIDILAAWIDEGAFE